jgi:hemoglobin-like flavoprotein
MSEFDAITPRQVELIRHSFDAIWPVRGKLAAKFYERFFELAPDVRRLFPPGMERQNLKLMDMIAAIVGAIENRDTSVPSSTTRAAITLASAPGASISRRSERP